MKSLFGADDPREMPRYFFGPALFIDYATAKRANIGKQNYTVRPRSWYVDVEYECPACKKLFIWTAKEQRIWFEVCRILVDAHPHSCRSCRKEHRRLKELRKEYDEIVAEAASGDPAKRKRVIEIVGMLGENLNPLPEAMRAKAKWFARSSAPEAAERTRRPPSEDIQHEDLGIGEDVP